MKGGSYKSSESCPIDMLIGLLIPQLGLLLIAFAFSLYQGVQQSVWFVIGDVLVGVFRVIYVI